MRKVIYKEDLAIIDSGLFFGRGVFETILVNANAIFLKEHIDRLNKSILALNLGEEISYEEVYCSIISRRYVCITGSLRIQKSR